MTQKKATQLALDSAVKEKKALAVKSRCDQGVICAAAHPGSFWLTHLLGAVEGGREDRGHEDQKKSCGQRSAERGGWLCQFQGRRLGHRFSTRNPWVPQTLFLGSLGFTYYY